MKTEAIERGIATPMAKNKTGTHPAFSAYRALKLVAEAPPRSARHSIDPMKKAMQAKYPD